MIPQASVVLTPDGFQTPGQGDDAFGKLPAARASPCVVAIPVSPDTTLTFNRHGTPGRRPTRGALQRPHPRGFPRVRGPPRFALCNWFVVPVKTVLVVPGSQVALLLGGWWFRFHEGCQPGSGWTGCRASHRNTQPGGGYPATRSGFAVINSRRFRFTERHGYEATAGGDKRRRVKLRSRGRRVSRRVP